MTTTLVATQTESNTNEQSNETSKEVSRICRTKLLLLKDEIMNRARHNQQEFSTYEKVGGDEIDQAVGQLAEDQFLRTQDRLRKQLIEIEYALGRIQTNEFGICEETQEPIERERLMALPYTRLSIEGAEMRERQQKKTNQSF